MASPMIEQSVQKATGIMYNITGGQDLTLQEVNRCGALHLSTPDAAAVHRSDASCW